MQQRFVARLFLLLSFASLAFGVATLQAQPARNGEGGEGQKEATGMLDPVAAFLTVCSNGCDHTTIQAAHGAATGGDTIYILDEVITESGITIEKDITILGLGAALTTVQAAATPGTASDRVFEISSGTVLIGEMTIRHGNGVDYGGGIFNFYGDVTIRNSRITQNYAGEGGGINNYQGELAIHNSTIDSNQATTNTAGGLYAGWSDTKIAIHNSTISDNTAQESGGGIAMGNRVAVEVWNSTIANNVADYNSDGSGDGGGAAIYGTSIMTMTNSIIANNLDTGGQEPDCGGFSLSSGGVTSAGHTLVGDTTGCPYTAGPGDQLNVSPLLIELRHNGGATPTMAISGRSPAVGAGDLASCPNVDQRGTDRKGDGECDIGAFEHYGVEACRTPNVTIPDDDPTGVYDVILLPTEYHQEIVDLDVSVAISHTYVQDLSLTLTESRDAKEARLIENVAGCYQDDIEATFDNEASDPVVTCDDPVAIEGSFQPLDSLAELTGVKANVPLVLQVADNFPGDVGTLKSWCIYAELRPELAPSKTNDPFVGDCLPGACSLREAVFAANGSPGWDVITLDAQKYDLSIGGIDDNLNLSGDLDITDDLFLFGKGQDKSIIDAGGIDRVIDIIGGSSVQIEDLTIQGGDSGEAYGAGIWSWDGSILVRDVIVRQNKTDQLGGGIGTGGDAFLFIERVTIDDNEASFGGGIFNGGLIHLVESTVSMNRATVGGGGIDNQGTLNVWDSTISDNEANNGSGSGAGGGIQGAFDSQINLYNSTLSGNLAGGAAGDGGGGIMLYGGSVFMSHVTLADNRSQAGGGVISISPLTGNATLTVQNTILDGSTPNCAIIPVSGKTATLVSNGYNIALDATCQLTGPQDQPSTPSLIGPLADNGGPTLTVGLLPGSLAVDAANEAFCNDSNIAGVDQRGRPRPVDGDADGVADCDIGAFEATFYGVYLPLINVSSK